MKRSMIIGLVSGAALAVTSFLAAPAAMAGTTFQEPSDCTTFTTQSFSVYHYVMTCTARPAGQQWQEVAYCLPRGSDGAEYVVYGTIATGNGQSTGSSCQANSSSWFAEVDFSNSGLTPPGRYPF
jgi:hypothetical protein